MLLQRISIFSKFFVEIRIVSHCKAPTTQKYRHDGSAPYRDPSKTQAPSFRTRPGWSCCRLADQFSTLGHLCSSVGSVTVTTNASRVPSGHGPTAARRTAQVGLSFEFLSDPWLFAHQQATEKVNPATVQRLSAAVADVFTATSTPISSARAVNVS